MRALAPASFFLAILAGIPGCFAIFPLDEYQEGSPLAPDAGVSDAPSGDVDAGDGGPMKPPGRIMFVTSARFTGNLGGLAGADAKCADAARAAGLSGSFKAYLGVAGSGVIKRFTDTTEALPIVDTSDRTIAASYAKLTVGTPAVAINQTEKKTTIVQPVANDAAVPCDTSGDDVWSGTNTNGSASGADCNGWTDEADTANADVGIPFTTGTGWVKACTVPCNRGAHLYCAQP